MSVREEHEAVRSSAGFWLLHDVGVLRAVGKDRLSWTNGMVSNDLRPVPDGGAMPAGILTAKGKFVALVDVWRDPDAIWVLVEGGQVEAARKTLDSLLVMEEVELVDRSADFAVVTVQGPRANDARAVGGVGARDKDRSGSGGIDLLVPRADVARLEDALAAKAKRISEEAVEVLRVEGGIRRWGREVDEDTFPQEARLEETHVSFQKGCFVGQETVVRLRDRGHANRFVVGLDLADAPVPERGSVIRAAQTDVGSVTSAVRSLSLGRTIAMGFVKRTHADPGNALVVAGAAATVVPLPFVGRS